MKLTAHQHDTLDSLLSRHYGTATVQWVELALELNPHLADLPILPLGTVVEMPDHAPVQHAIKSTVQLWD